MHAGHFPVRSTQKDPQALPFCALRVVFRAHIVTGELRHEINGSSDTARWVPIAELDTIRYGTLIDEVASMMGYSNAASWAREYREFLADENARSFPNEPTNPHPPCGAHLPGAHADSCRLR